MISSGSSSSRAALRLLLAAALACPAPKAAAQGEPTAPQAGHAAPPAVPEPASPEAGPPAPQPPLAGAPDGWRTFEAERDVTPAPLAEPSRARRFALFPIQNLSGAAAPVRELTAALRGALERNGVSLAPDAEVRAVLSEMRIRYLGGLDASAAVQLKARAQVDGVIIASLDAWSPDAPYRMALSSRLVSTDPDPLIQWSGHFSRTGDDAPGLLSLGVLSSVEQLGDLAVEQVARSLAASLRRPGPRAPCPGLSGIRPRRHFRSPLVADEWRQRIAVLPFLETSGRRDAGEVVALRFQAALAASDTIRLVEAGEVRAEMLAHRLGATGPLSLDDARVILELVDADLVLSGTVRTFEEAAGSAGAPRVEVTVWVLDRSTAELVWSSTSSAAGDDGVFLFGLGRTSTASGLACRLAKGVVDTLLRGRQPLPALAAAGTAPRGGRGGRAAPP